VQGLFGLHAELHADRRAARHASQHAEQHAGRHFMTPGMPGCMQPRIHMSILGCMPACMPPDIFYF